MQIKVIVGEAATTVEVVNPVGTAVLESATLQPGEQIVVTAVNAHDPSDIEFGEVLNQGGPEDQAEAPAEEGDAGGESDPEGEAASGSEEPEGSE